jgi:4-hydroxyphenylacetate decarboxylase small subunit
MELTCKDCKYYLPVDVFRGLCKQDSHSILPEDNACKDFERIPKCKFCSKYEPEKDYIGKCDGKVLAYPDMIASKCITFEWYNQN